MTNRRLGTCAGVLVLLLTGCAVTPTPTTSPAEQLDFRHWAEGVLIMALQGRRQHADAALQLGRKLDARDRSVRDEDRHRRRH